jgi:hypothetical protein
MHQILARVPAFVGFVFLVVLATAAPVLTLALLAGAITCLGAAYALRQEPEPRGVRIRTEAPPRR